MSKPIALAVCASLLLASPVSFAKPDSKDAPQNAAATETAKQTIDYDKLPNVLDCNQFSWMKNCEAINRQAKRNPAAPIRVKAQDGTEYTFAPQTPSTVIAHMLHPTIQTARAMVLQERRMSQRDDKAANLARQAIKQIYGSFGFQGFDHGLKSIEQVRDDNAAKRIAEIHTPKHASAIDTSGLKVYVFYDSRCGYCRKNIPEWKKLVEAYPSLNIHFLQFDQDPSFLHRMRAVYGFKAATLKGDRRKQIMDRVSTTPTVWIQDDHSDVTRVVKGYTEFDRMQGILAQVANKG